MLVTSKLDPYAVRNGCSNSLYWSWHKDSLALGTQERRAKVLYNMSICRNATSIGLWALSRSKAANPFTIFVVNSVRCSTSLIKNCLWSWLSLMKTVSTVSVVAWVTDRSDFLKKCTPSARALLAAAALLVNLRWAKYSSQGKMVPSLVWKRRSKNQAFSRAAVSGCRCENRAGLWTYWPRRRGKKRHHTYIVDSQRSWSHLESQTHVRIRTIERRPHFVRTYLQVLTSLLKNSSLTTKITRRKSRTTRSSVPETEIPLTIWYNCYAEK